MLTYDMDERISAKEVLNSEWVKHNSITKKLNTNTLKNLS